MSMKKQNCLNQDLIFMHLRKSKDSLLQFSNQFGENSDEELNIWVNRSRQYVNLITNWDDELLLKLVWLRFH